ncbi:hypothetical protein Aperf_G00000123443 [Anoplocephala perfoliata]
MSLTHWILPINESSGFDLEPVNKTVIPLTPPRRGKSVSDLPVELGKSTATLRHAPRSGSPVLEVLQSPRPVLYQMIRESVKKSPRSSNEIIECTNSGSFDSAQTDSDFMQDLDSSRKPEVIEPVSAESFDTAQLTMNHNNPKCGRVAARARPWPSWWHVLSSKPTLAYVRSDQSTTGIKCKC